MASAIKTSKLNPKFLHSNSTTHTWVFSAIAELIDNAYDTDVGATDLWIDQENINGIKCLTFVDNGSGMTYVKLHEMLSFGFNEKEDRRKWMAIGKYGNGFKSGSMRLGSDAVVITRSLQSMSVGFLSQTYLKAIGADVVFVPMVTWDITPRGLLRKNSPENDSSMKVILQFSPFKSEEELKNQLCEKLGPNKTGTKIIIYNLKRDNAKNLELDFESDVKDIRNPETAAMDQSVNERTRTAAVTTPEYRRSLRKYCSILYMKPRMNIFLRDEKVKAKWIPKTLSQKVKMSYNPKWAETRLGVTLTYKDKDKSENAPYGLMLYHHSRLIQAYKKIGCQNKANGEGAGVICVVEADFLEPIHNKQDFNITATYLALINNVSKKLKDYLDEKGKSKPSSSEPSPSPSEESEECWNWARCDRCFAWRRLPQGYSTDTSRDWFCYNNPDPLFNRCAIPEELEGNDEGIFTPKLSCKKAAKKENPEQNKQAKQEESEKRLKALEKEKKKIAYINPVKAAEEKKKGNEFFRQGELQGRNRSKTVTDGQKIAATSASGQEAIWGLQTSQNQTGIEIQNNQAQIKKSSSLDLSLKRKITDTDLCDADTSSAKRLVRRGLHEDQGTSSASNISCTSGTDPMSSNLCEDPGTGNKTSTSTIDCTHLLYFLVQVLPILCLAVWVYLM